MLKKWYLFVLFILIFSLVGLLYIRYSIPKFRVWTTMQITSKENPLSSLQDVFDKGGPLMRAGRGNPKVEEEMIILGSRSTIRTALDQLNINVSYYKQGKVIVSEVYGDKLPIRVILNKNSKQLINTTIAFEEVDDKTFKLVINGNKGKLYDLSTRMTENVFLQTKVVKECSYGSQCKTEYFDFVIEKKDASPESIQDDISFFQISSTESLVDYYKEKTSVTLVQPNTSIIQITSNGEVREKEIDFINMLVETYINDKLGEKQYMVSNAIEFIDQQLSSISDSLEVAERSLETFRSKNSILDMNLSTEKLIQELQMLEASKGEMEIQQQYFNYALKYFSRKDVSNQVFAPSLVGIKDPVTSKLIETYAELLEKKVEHEFKYTDQGPFYQKLENQIEKTLQELITNAENAIKSNNEILDIYNDKIRHIESEISKVPKTQRNFLSIKRKFELNNTLYVFLLEKKAELGISKASITSENRVIDSASQSGVVQVSPKPVPIFAGLIILGILIPTAFIFIQSYYFENSIVSVDEVKAITEIPILGFIPRSNGATNIVVANNPKSPISEMFRSIRINLKYVWSGKRDYRVISVTSSVSGEGKTFCSLNLACTLAFSGKKVILIGADMRKPKIFNDFGLLNDFGLSTYLSNSNKPVEEAIQQTFVENLDLMTSGPIPPNPVELLERDRMQDLVTELKKVYDIIIIDTPPLGLVSDVFTIYKYSDVNLFMVREGYTLKNDVSTINSIYTEGAIKELAIIYNDVGVKGGSYGSSYGYGYRANYGYYEEDSSNENSSLWKKITLRLFS